MNAMDEILCHTCSDHIQASPINDQSRQPLWRIKWRLIEISPWVGKNKRIKPGLQNVERYE